MISELPPASTGLSSSICKRITGRLTETISKVCNCSIIVSSHHTGSNIQPFIKSQVFLIFRDKSFLRLGTFSNSDLFELLILFLSNLYVILAHAA